MIRVLVLVPVLGRPERVRPLAESLAASVTGPLLRADLLFLANRDDTDEIGAVGQVMQNPPDHVHVNMNVLVPAASGDYARKINHGWRSRSRNIDFVLLGADDLRFHPGWLEAALIEQLRTGACVIGTNDLGNSKVIAGEHSTHPLVSTAYRYGLVDDQDPGKLYNEAYDHQYCDTEFVGTAKLRRTYAHAHGSHVEHLHPYWGKADMDDTYTKGLARSAEDADLYRSRRPLWEKNR